jgi:hypothetical protein
MFKLCCHWPSISLLQMPSIMDTRVSPIPATATKQLWYAPRSRRDTNSFRLSPWEFQRRAGLQKYLLHSLYPNPRLYFIWSELLLDGCVYSNPSFLQLWWSAVYLPSMQCIILKIVCHSEFETNVDDLFQRDAPLEHFELSLQDVETVLTESGPTPVNSTKRRLTLNSNKSRIPSTS